MTDIREDDLTGPEIADLLQAHLNLMRTVSPPGTSFALDLDGLRVPEVTFWCLWDEGDLAGCGALKEHNPDFGEIKSMHTAERHRGKGYGDLMLKHIIAEAQARGYSTLALETGTHPAFDAAHGLYAKYGFEYCEAFADYENGEHNVCRSLKLEAS